MSSTACVEGWSPTRLQKDKPHWGGGQREFQPCCFNSKSRSNLGYIQVISEHLKITGRQVAASVDLSRTNPVKCKWSRFERSGHCSARAAAGAEAAEGAGAAPNGLRGGDGGAETDPGERGWGMEEQREDVGTEYRGKAAWEPDEFSGQLASPVISACGRAFGHTWSVKVHENCSQECSCTLR